MLSYRGVAFSLIFLYYIIAKIINATGVIISAATFDISAMHAPRVELSPFDAGTTILFNPAGIAIIPADMIITVLSKPKR